jgi:hypothetical protein
VCLPSVRVCRLICFLCLSAHAGASGDDLGFGDSSFDIGEVASVPSQSAGVGLAANLRDPATAAKAGASLRSRSASPYHLAGDLPAMPMPLQAAIGPSMGAGMVDKRRMTGRRAGVAHRPGGGGFATMQVPRGGKVGTASCPLPSQL